MDEKKIQIDLESNSIDESKKEKGKKKTSDENLKRSSLKLSPVNIDNKGKDLKKQKITKTSLDVKNEMSILKNNTKNDIEDIKKNLNEKLKYLNEEMLYYQEFENYQKEKEKERTKHLEEIRQTQKHLEERIEKLNSLNQLAIDKKIEHEKKQKKLEDTIDLESKEITMMNEDLKKNRKNIESSLRNLDNEVMGEASESPINTKRIKRISNIKEKKLKYKKINNDFKITEVDSDIENTSPNATPKLKKIVKDNIYKLVNTEDILQNNPERITIRTKSSIDKGELFSPELRKQETSVVYKEPDFFKELSSEDQRLFYNLSNEFGAVNHNQKPRPHLNAFKKSAIRIDSTRRNWLIENKYIIDDKN